VFAASLGENLTRFSSETREILVEQLLDLVQNPRWSTVHPPLRISRRTRKVLIRRQERIARTKRRAACAALRAEVRRWWEAAQIELPLR